jgi:hypothetical protein
MIYSIHLHKKKKRRSWLDGEIGGDTKLFISMQSMNRIQFGEILNSNPFASRAPYKAL